MNPEEFINELKEVFWNKNKLMNFTLSQQNSMFDTIKSFLQKKNLIVVSKAEHENLCKAYNHFKKLD